jgi:hypothetical protein
MTYNGLPLGVGREIEFGLPTPALMLIKDIKSNLCSSALLLPNRCWQQACLSLKSFQV